MLEKLDQSEKAVVTIWVKAKKFRDYDNVDFQKLAFFLLRKCADYGREKPPIVQEVINWTIEIGRSYPNLSLEDLNLAFQLAATSQLVWRQGDEWKAQNLDKFVWETFLTMCKVCTGYIEYQRGKMKNYNREVNNRFSEIQAEHQSEKMWKEYVKEWKTTLYEAYQRFKKEGEFILEDTYCSFFQQLRKAGYITLNESDYEAVKWIVNQDLDDVVSEKLKTISGVDVRDIPAYRKDLQKTVFQMRCCSLSIKMQFEKWIEQNKDVATIIKEINLVK